MHKTFTAVTIKDVDQGLISAKIATLGVIDRDGDVILDGALEPTEVVISAYGHKSWDGRLPVGKGVFKQSGTDLVFDGQFFLDTTDGRDTFNAVKALAELGEWSFSLEDVDRVQVKVAGVTASGIKSFTAREVSPVLRGASIDSRTLTTKGTKQLDSSIRRLLALAGRERWPDAWPYVEDFDVDAGFVVFELYRGNGVYELVQVDFTRTDTSVTLGATETPVHQTAVFLAKSAKFSEHATAVLAAVDELTARASEVMALRAEKGKTISDHSAGLLAQVGERLDGLKTLLGTPTTTPTDDALSDLVANELVRFISITGAIR